MQKCQRKVETREVLNEMSFLANQYFAYFESPLWFEFSKYSKGQNQLIIDLININSSVVEYVQKKYASKSFIGH